MYIVYTAIAIVVIFIIVSAILRKQIYKEVDRLEEWKNAIINRPIPDEIGKVKKLQMSGETEEKFELWRSEWDDIVGVIIPNIGESLFDIEDLVTKNRFKKAKQLITVTDQRLSGIEQQLAKMSAEIEQLVESEKQNRTEIEDVRSLFKELTAELMKRRGALGEGTKSFDEKIENINELLTKFDEATIEGSYLQARENLIQATDLIQETRDLLERYPQLLVTLETTIPHDLESLREGVKEMEEEGYFLEPFELTSRIEFFQDKLAQLKDEITALECDKVEGRIDELTSQIEQLYDVLEYEILSHQYIIEELPKLKERTEQIDQEIDKLQEETTYVQQSYHIPKEQQKSQTKMRDSLLELTRQLAVLDDVTSTGKQTFTSIREMVDEWQEKMEKLENDLKKEKESLYKMREEEWQAKEMLRTLRDQLLETKWMIQKSNIPGLPESALDQLKWSEQKLKEASLQLEQVPLELGRIAVLVNEAEEAVQGNHKAIKEVIETAELAERVIQFGNRYRSRSEETHLGLKEAEQLFRHCEYDAALERAISVIQVYEPNVLDRVSEYLQVQ